MDTAIRVYPTFVDDHDDAQQHDGKKGGSRGVSSVPQRVVVFDCETTADTTQRLLFGSWRIFIDDQDHEPGAYCIEEGIFYADDLPVSDPKGYRRLRDYARRHAADVAPGVPVRRLKVLSRAEFVEQVIFRWGHRLRSPIVGFNLPFDLSRLAVHVGKGRRQFTGAVSLQLATHHGRNNRFRPWIAIKTIDSRRAVIQFTGTVADGDQYRGRFLDLATLSFAHSSQRDRLETACERFGVPYTKRDVVHGYVGAHNITYCREDVAATAQLYTAVETEHRLHPIPYASDKVKSAAGIARGYWAAMGITPFAARESPPDPQIAGYAMAAYYGGRAECRIRHTDVPVVSVDFLSMYMTCNVLMDTWSHICANHTSIVNTTAEVRALLADPDLAGRCFNPELWPMLHTLVEVEPNGAILPVRASFDGHTWGVAVTPFHAPQPRWYPVADVIAAVLLGGPTPIVHRALRLVPSDDKIRPLRPVRLRGQVRINPNREDFFAAIVEHRHRTRNDPNLEPAERERLQQSLKLIGNSSGYGTLSQFIRYHTRNPVDITLYTDTEPISYTDDVVEQPGIYTHPALAACLTGAARLMLALLEHHVTQHGGTYAMCDTDSMAIVANPNGTAIPTADGPTIPALDWATVDTIVEQFSALNPYNPKTIDGSILEYEKYNFDTDGNQREINCYAISAKRYQLTTVDGANLKASASGLGQLINPATGNDDTDWITDAWDWIRNPDGPEPPWLDQPALTRFSVSGPDALDWFGTINDGLDYPDRIKPHNFILVAQPDPLDPTDAQPISPHHTTPHGWQSWTWIDRTTSQPIHVHTHPLDGYHRDGVRILTYRDILTRYRLHPEHKTLDHTGRPCRPTTRGLLHRRPVRAVDQVEHIGKEAHNLDRRAHGIHGNIDTLTYTNDATWDLALRVLDTITTREIADATGVHPRTVQRVTARAHTPRSRDRTLLYRHAVTHARDTTHVSRSVRDAVVMHYYLTRATDT